MIDLVGDFVNITLCGVHKILYTQVRRSTYQGAGT